MNEDLFQASPGPIKTTQTHIILRGIKLASCILAERAYLMTNLQSYTKGHFYVDVCSNLLSLHFVLHV